MAALSRRQLMGGGLLLGAAWVSVHVVGHRPLPLVDSPFLGSAGRRTLIAVLQVLLPVPEAAERVADGVDAFLAQGDPVPAEQLRLALGLVEHTAGAGLLSFSRFSRLGLEDRTAALRSWEHSRLGTKRQVFQALRTVAGFSWYSRPESWESIGYDGPLVDEGTP